MPKALFKIVLLAFFGLHAFKDVNASPFSDKSPIILQSQSFGVPQGLSQSTVTSIVTDNDGYIWIGTLNGLNRFDGKEFKHFYADNSASGLPSSFIRSLLITEEGDLLVGTDKGLAIYDRNDESLKFIDVKNEYLNGEIWSLSNNDFTKEILVGTNKGILSLNLKNKSLSLEHIEKEYFEVKKSVNIGDEIFIKSYDGKLYRINSSNNKVQIIDNVLDIEKENETLYISTENGLYTYSDKRILKLSNSKYTLLSRSNSDIYGIDKNKIYSVNNEPYLIGKTVDEKEKSKETYLFSTADYLIIGMNNQGFEIIRKSNNLVLSTDLIKDNVWHISKTFDSKILISSDDSILRCYDTNLNLIKTYQTGIAGYKNSVMTKYGIYIGNEKGVIFLHNNGNISSIIEGEQVTTIDLINNNENIIVGTASGKALIIKDNLISKKITTNKKDPVFEILYISDANIYLASQNGLYHYTDNETNKIADELTYSITKFRNEIIFGTSTAIKKYNPISKKTNKLFSDNKEIYSILTLDNYIFASSLGQIVLIDDDSNYIFSTNNGSQYEYNTRSSVVIDNENIFFGGIDGLSLISKDIILDHIKNVQPPETFISGLRIFNSVIAGDGEYFKGSISKSKSIQLKYSDYPFTITFNSPTSEPSTTSYYYKMNGLSDEWIASNKINSATYTNLSPDEYIFKVYAVDSLTQINGPVKELKVIITPPWWLSKLAKLIYFIIIVIIFLGVTKSILRKREVQRQIALSEERLKLSLWGSGDEMWDWDIETGNIFRSNIWGALEFPRDGHRSGKSDEESNIHPMDQERVREALNKHFYGETDHFEAAYRVKGKDDNWIWILDRAKIVERDDKDNALRMTGTIKNISQFKQKEEQLKLFEKAIENISEGMFILDGEYRFVEVNEACCKISLHNRTDFIGNVLTFDLYPETFSTQIRTILKQQGRWTNEVEAIRGDKSRFNMELTIDAIYDEQGELSHYVGIFSDISRRKQQEEELRKLTNNDVLTGLPNRSNLQVTLSNLVNKEIAHALMVLDLDNFKRINDSLGHQVGDTLLQQVSVRIKSLLPKNTSIYRLGGDEFAIVLDKISDINASAAIASRIIEGLKPAFEINNELLVLGLSIGIVLFPEDEQNEQALLRKADIAMYHAKSAGGNCYQFYSEPLNQHAIRQLEVETLIREGLKEDLFEVYYQPKIDLKRGKITGMEALVRLNHPIHGLIPPNDFIPLAEENGLIVEIGEIVLRKACFAAQNWREQGIFSGRVAVNLSSRQFALPDLQQRIESILRLTKLPACHLELEITEGTVIKQPETAIIVMQQLAKMGVSLALDDFGTGYSSLSYLKRFPIHTLKIDKAFVDDIDKSDRDLKMVDSIITIAHNMGLSVVGEGVEQTAQLNILRALNCEEIQGYIFSKAIKETEFTLLLQEDMIKPNTKSNIN
ncbi:EAL domain-containing protein [Shewanella glacialipiscicola]|uniref:EAL domain-containing protein n=2 Tax=Shewanella glacialipiscicola TaxID=614069 RepID=UPI003D79EEAC